MRDKELIEALEADGGSSGAAKRLGLSPQVWTNWKKRGLPENGHLRAWLALNHPVILRRWLADRDGE